MEKGENNMGNDLTVGFWHIDSSVISGKVKYMNPSNSSSHKIGLEISIFDKSFIIFG
jgi:hypothetical protein